MATLSIYYTTFALINLKTSKSNILCMQLL